ncbi:MAG: cyclic nucleotide-binding domain-containing protein [Candidatus Neomarinimicrobiota bacterium]
MDKREILRRCEITNGLTDREIDALADIFQSVHFHNEDVIFREGETSNDIYVIAKGVVNVVIYSKVHLGESEKITTLKDGDIFGEFSMLDGAERSATLIAEEDIDLIVAAHLDFHRFLENHEHVGFLIMRNLARTLTARLRKMNHEVRNAIL